MKDLRGVQELCLEHLKKLVNGCKNALIDD